jgi:type VI secretion system protein ImpG
LSGAHAGAFVRGTEIKLTLDEDDFVGAGAYLFASVLERFFALYTAPNSFTRLKVHTKQREGEVFAWAPRSGQAPLI